MGLEKLAIGSTLARSASGFETGNVLGVQVGAVSTVQAAQAICSLIDRHDAEYVCAAPVHSIMEARDDEAFRAVLNGAYLVVPDGFPVAAVLRAQGFRGQKRVPGPDLMLELCREAAERGIRVGFYGSSEECLDLLAHRLPAQIPSIQIAYQYSPPDKVFTAEEDAEIVASIRDSGTQLLFVGLGCPKQERWMHAHIEQVGSVMVGVGAAFDFHAGLLQRAPKWMQAIGLEWLFRLAKEPRRLWRRYLKHNPRFVFHATLQMLGLRKYG